MAVLTSSQLQQARQNLASDGNGIAYTKTQVNAGIQAIEDTMRGAAVQNALSSAIDTAMQGVTVGAALKRRMFREWALLTFGAGG